MVPLAACRQKWIHESNVSSVGDFSRDPLILLHIISHRAKWEVWIIIYYTNIKHRWILITVRSITVISLIKCFINISVKDTFWFKNRKQKKKHLMILSQISFFFSSFEVSPHLQFIALSRTITYIFAVSFQACDIFYIFSQVNQLLTKCNSHN